MRHPRLLPALVCVATAFVGANSATAAAASPAVGTIAASACAKFAAPGGSDSAAGTLSAPYATPQKLVDALAAGQAGCLRGGTYGQGVSISRGGITLTAYPGEAATIVGRFYVKAGADGVTVSNLNLNGRNATSLPSPTVNANDTKFLGNDVTDEHTEICFVIGSGWGRAKGTIIRGNRIHACGALPSTNMDHGIYVEASDNAQILDNVIYDNADRGIQLYPDAQGTVIRGNVIDGNGEGIIFSGAGGSASNSTTVDHNLITNSTIRNDVESWYPTGNPVGTNNLVQQNCLVKGARGTINTSNGGFTATSNSVVSDALYVSRSAGDFRLQDASPCASYVTSSAAPAGADWQPLSATATTGSTTTSTSTSTSTTTTTTSGHHQKKLAASSAEVRRHSAKAKQRRRRVRACHRARYRHHHRKACRRLLRHRRPHRAAPRS